MPSFTRIFPGAYLLQYASGETYHHNRDWAYLHQSKSDRKGDRRPKRQPMPPKSYSFLEDTRTAVTGTIRTYVDGLLHSTESGVLADAPPNNTEFVPSYLVNQALIDCLTQVKGQRVNLGVALLEAQSTANTLGDGFERIAAAYRKLKRRDPKGALKAFTTRNWREIPNRWLEYQYGLKPLFQDLQGAVSELTEQRDASAWWQTFTGRAKEMRDESHLSYIGWLPSTSFVRREYRAQVGLSFIPNNNMLTTLARLGTLNTAEMLWEKTPFSFVVDWAFPVGDYFHVLDATVGWRFLHGYQTTSSRTTSRRVVSSSVQTGRVKAVGSDLGQGKAMRFMLQRSVLPSVPTPSLPTFKNPISLGHLANGLSLLASVTGQKPPRVAR